MLGSGVILALLSIKLHKPAGRTKKKPQCWTPLSPRGCYFQKCLAKSLLPGVYFPSLIFCTSPKPENTTRSPPALQEGTSVSPQDGAGQGQSGPKLGFPTGKGERGHNDACDSLQGIVPGYSMSWLWEEDEKTNTSSV